jgi:hypothetical protein
MVISRSIPLIMRNVSHKSCIKSQNTYFRFNQPPSPRKNIVQQDRPQMTIWRMRITCWIPNVTNIHSQYVILTALPPRKWLHKRASVFRYTYSACLVGTSHYIWTTSLTPPGITNEIWYGVKQTSLFLERWCFNYFFVEDFWKAMFLTWKIFYSLKSNKKCSVINHLKITKSNH